MTALGKRRARGALGRASGGARRRCAGGPARGRHPQGGDAGGRGRTSARSSRSDRASEPRGEDERAAVGRAGRNGRRLLHRRRSGRAARRARRRGCWSPARARARLSGRASQLDALVLSGDDAIERRQAERAQDEAELVVFTEGARGGAYRERSGESGDGTAAARCPPRRSTPTAAATPSRRGSPMAGRRPGGAGRPGARRSLRRRSVSPAAGRTSASST